MPKTKPYKLHKIKIHPNRWLIWAIAYILFVAIALIGYLKISNINIDSENSAQSVYLPAHNYTATSLGFSVKYPTSWSIEANSASSVTFLPSDSPDTGVTIIVTTPGSEKSIRKSLNIFSESKIALGNVLAAKIVNDLGTGHYETVVIGTYNNKLYVVRGSDNFVENLLQTFHFLALTK